MAKARVVGQYIGKTMRYTPSGVSVEKNEILVIGGLLAIALADIADGETGDVAIEEVWELPKLDAAVIAQGDYVDYDVSAGEIDDNAMTPASGDLSDCGVAMEGKGATTGEYIAVKINAHAGTAT